MACCPKGIYTPLVLNCAGTTVSVPSGGLLRGGHLILGAGIQTVSSDIGLYTNTILLVDATAAPVTISLPAADIGLHFVIKKIDSSANVVTVDGDASETIDGLTTKTLTSQYDVVDIVSDGTEWWII